MILLVFYHDVLINRKQTINQINNKNLNNKQSKLPGNSFTISPFEVDQNLTEPSKCANKIINQFNISYGL